MLREEKGGTYGASAGGACSSIPYEHYSMTVEFGSAPERVDELVASVFKVFDEIKAGIVSDSNLTKIREIELRGARNRAQTERGMAECDDATRTKTTATSAISCTIPDLVKALTRETDP